MFIKVGTLCSGYDSQCMALDRLHQEFPQFDYDLVFWCEIDKYAIQAHNAVYPQYADRNLGDLTQVDWYKVDKVDLLTYSTPCQDISTAGLQKGLSNGSNTRSSIIWNVADAIRVLKPMYLLMENVKALISNKFKEDFIAWQDLLSELGYRNFFKVLNAKDYGVPQNRERVFMVSILDEGIMPGYEFPRGITSTDELQMANCLESNVDAKYFLSQRQIATLQQRLKMK